MLASLAQLIVLITLATAASTMDPVPSAIEAAVVVTALLFTRRFPRAAGVFAFAVAAAVAYVLAQSSGSVRVEGSAVAGQHTMRAAVFGTEGEHVR